MCCILASVLGILFILFSVSSLCFFLLLFPCLLQVIFVFQEGILWLSNLLLSLFSQATNENLPPNVIKQLAKELKNLDESPPEGIKVGVNDDDFSNIYADIEGPGLEIFFCWNLCSGHAMEFQTDVVFIDLGHAAGTPYENGVFRMKLLLPHDFPHSPPKGWLMHFIIFYFKTRIL